MLMTENVTGIEIQSFFYLKKKKKWIYWVSFENTDWCKIAVEIMTEEKLVESI